ncbi:MAG: AraC family transcriptional regulator [Longimicrobiales bacterium]
MSFVYFEVPPPTALAPFVECLWGVRGSAHYHVESVLPNGAMELMINFGPRQTVVGYGDRVADDPFDRAWLAGIQDQRLVHASPAGADHISARFRPGGAHAFFDLPMDEVANQVVSLDDLIGASATADLRDRLGAVDDDVARCGLLGQWLLDRRAAVHPWWATARRAADLLRGHARGMAVGDVCDRLGLSHRYLIQQFRTTVGLAPKTFGRVQRFQGVIDDCRGRRTVQWSRLAARHGYADQSHMIREFRRFAAVTPTQFLARRTPDESHVVVE